MAERGDDLMLEIPDPQPRRRKSDADAASGRAAVWKVLLNAGVAGVFCGAFLYVGNRYFQNAEERNREFIGEQRTTINKQQELLDKQNTALISVSTENTKALIGVSLESVKAISKNTEVMQGVQQELRGLRRDRLAAGDKPADVIDVEEFRKP